MSDIKLTVVIPTIGRPVLVACLNAIDEWKLKPDEIIIVLPHGVMFDVSSYNGKLNLKIIHCERGQVKQRIIGFQISKGMFVMQLDDDVFLSREATQILIEYLQKSDELAVGPVWYKLPQNTPFFQAPATNIERVKEAILAMLLGSNVSVKKRMGTISKAGVAYGVDPRLLEGDYLSVEWLSGGCMLHRRKNLVIENYYPYSGRASHEDLFHSWILRTKGIELRIIRDARAATCVERKYEKTALLFHQLRIQSEFVRIAELTRTRFLFWTLYCVAVSVLKRAMSFLIYRSNADGNKQTPPER